MANHTLFVGNGPNRLSTDSHSWEGVLKRLAGFANQPEVLQGRNTKPFPVLFEEVSLRVARNGWQEEELKQCVADWVTELRPNWLHDRLLGLAGPNLLTTNYDYCTDKARGGVAHRVDFFPESRYSLFRCQQVGLTRVWHVHGEAQLPSTLVLGYEQYVGYLHKARRYLASPGQEPLRPNEVRSPILDSRYDFENLASPFSWVDVFLRDHVHIVGFGGDYSEIDFWWLLGQKQRIRLKDARLTKTIPVGATKYYYFDNAAMRQRERAHLAALDSFGVELVGIPIRNKNYLAGWERLCDLLDRELPNDR